MPVLGLWTSATLARNVGLEGWPTPWRTGLELSVQQSDDGIIDVGLSGQ